MSGENIFRYDLFSFVESNQNRDFFYDTFFKERRIDESMFNSGYWGKLGRSYFTSYSMPFRSSMTEFSTELSYHWVWDKEQYDHHLDDPLSKYELSEVYKLTSKFTVTKEILLSKAYIAGQQVMSFSCKH